jgi:hypothetical protein
MKESDKDVVKVIATVVSLVATGILGILGIDKANKDAVKDGRPKPTKTIGDWFK